MLRRASTSSVVQLCPAGVTYWRSSRQIGHEAGGCGVGAYCVPQVVQMWAGMTSGPLALLVRWNVVQWQTAETILTAPNKPGNRRFIELSMVGATRSEPVTPTMSR